METNVNVALRCRPLSQKEIARGCQVIIQCNTDKTVHISVPTNDIGNTSKQARDFTFDHCYDMNSTQLQVYNDVGAPVVTQALQGFNCTIFAYGQTGSGKSHSMMGATGNPLTPIPAAKKGHSADQYGELGIIPRLSHDLWNQLYELQILNKGKTDYMVTVSFLEIYNEEIKDLLNPRKGISGGMKIRENSEKGIYVEDLCELIVKDSSSMMKLIEQGNTVRKVAATNMNDNSSRSHSVFTICIEQKTETELLNSGGMHKVSLVKAKINLVDLAGSERAEKTGATGVLLKEGAGINMSLMALGNVINALSDAGSSTHTKDTGTGTGNGKLKAHIPYRDSKLTRLLQESLGGNAATVMLAAISPANYNFDETLSTLKYANRAKSIANAVTKNEDVNQRMINDLKKEIEELKASLSAQGRNGGASGGDSRPGSSGESGDAANQRLIEMEYMQKNSWEEKEKLALQLEEERQANLSVVMADMMEEVKNKKIIQMKQIKKLANEKTTLQRKLKETKAKHATLKEEVDIDMKSYATMQGKYDEELQAGRESLAENELLAHNMADALERIENRRVEWTSLKAYIKKMKDRIEKIDEEITDERAELVATAGLLDQNDILRKQIQCEERLRAKDMIEKEIMDTKHQLLAENGNELIEKKEIIIRLEENITIERIKNNELTMKLKERDKDILMKDKYMNELEEKLTDSEVLLEASLAENVTMTTEIANTAEMLSNSKNISIVMEQLKTQIADMEASKYNMFQSMMNQFQIEHKELLYKYNNSKDLLNSAVKDIQYLTKQNNNLQKSLEQALAWEPSVAGYKNSNNYNVKGRMDTIAERGGDK